ADPTRVSLALHKLLNRANNPFHKHRLRAGKTAPHSSPKSGHQEKPERRHEHNKNKITAIAKRKRLPKQIHFSGNHIHAKKRQTSNLYPGCHKVKGNQDNSQILSPGSFLAGTTIRIKPPTFATG